MTDRPTDTDRIPRAIAFMIGLLTLAVYLPALRNQFVIWDDDRNLLGNPHIRSLGGELVRWAFSDITLSYWQPVTWITHALDFAVWGLGPAGHHLTNILLHAATTFLFVLVAFRLLEIAGTGAAGQPASRPGKPRIIAATAAGALFGLHPLHVESVAWVTGRPGMLCAFFTLLSVRAYLLYTETEAARAGGRAGSYLGNKQYLFSIGFFCLALASKPMAVSLPFVLLVLDWYPLARMDSRRDRARRVVEKVPFFVLSCALAVVTIAAHRSMGDLAAHQGEPFLARMLAAAYALLSSLGRILLPVRLSPYYVQPTPVSLTAFPYLASVVLLLAITAAAVALAFPGRRKAVLAVWCCFIASLLPVIGVVRVRAASMADRYLYLPDAGVFLLLGAAAAWLWTRTERAGPRARPARKALVALAITVPAVLAGTTILQTAVWKDTVALWGSVIRNEPDRVPAAYTNRGLAYLQRGQLDRAIGDFTRAVELQPDDPATRVNRGLTYQYLGMSDEALADFTVALSLDPRHARAYTSRGMWYKERGETRHALEDFDRAIEAEPARSEAYNDRGMIFAERGRYDRAIEDYTGAIERDPLFAEAYVNRGLAFEQTGDAERALADYTAAMGADPFFANAYTNRGLLYEQRGRLHDALADLERAVRLDPDGSAAYLNRGLVYEDLGRFDRAEADYDRAVALAPDDPATYSNRGILYAKMGRYDDAVRDQTQVLTLDPTFSRAYLDRGACERELGREEQARRDFRAACARGIGAGCDAARGTP